MSFTVELATKPCPSCGHSRTCWLWDGMTHNLAEMFHKAGFYEAMMNETGGTGTFGEVVLGKGRKPLARAPMTAAELLPLVSAGLQDMRDNPTEYRALEPENGWGKYEGALKFTEALAKACAEHPAAVVESRG